MWAEVGKQPIRPKGQGRGIMVRDFIDEQNGFLQLTDDEFKQAQGNHPGLWKDAYYLLKYGATNVGYWNSEKFMKQADKAINIAQINIQAPPIILSNCSMFAYSSFSY